MIMIHLIIACIMSRFEQLYNRPGFGETKEQEDRRLKMLDAYIRSSAFSNEPVQRQTGSSPSNGGG